MAKRILVIAAHPDDELLGCGGTVALHVKAGDTVTSVIVCEGESLRYGPGGVGQAEHIRRAAANLDHAIVFKALLIATRPIEAFIEAIYAFDTASSTEWAYPRTFLPDTWVDITATLEQKLAAMACYESEVREYPHPRSLEALRHRAHAWGNQTCMDAAEVFMTVRRTVRDGQTPG